MKVGRPLMLLDIDQKVQIFLMILKRNGGVVKTVMVNTASQALIGRTQGEHLESIDLVLFIDIILSRYSEK